ncbi:MAG: hypothetical protein ABI488_06030 [Polyangiaceae bacterium]
MMRGSHAWSIAFVFCAAACAGSTPPAADPSTAAPKAAAMPAPSASETEPKPEPEATAPKKEEVVEPAFTPDMSVDDAIKAAQNTERLNVDQETLSKPLTDEGLYAPCKPGSTHFTLRVAVWRGKAVAIDMTTTPKAPKLAECLKGRIHELTWPAKVPSLNTVEYSM